MGLGISGSPRIETGATRRGHLPPRSPQIGPGPGLTNPTQDRSVGLGRQCSLMTASRTVKVCGQELRVEVRPGSGTGTPLLMCCGIGISYEVFDLVVDALDPSIAIVRVDVPGVGCSPVRVWPYGFWSWRCCWMSWVTSGSTTSWASPGGALAQQFAVQYPGRCRLLVLICTSPGLPSIPGRPQVLVKMLTPKRELARQEGRLFVGGVSGGRTTPRACCTRGTSAVTVTRFGGGSGTARSGVLACVTCINLRRLRGGAACRSWGLFGNLSLSWGGDADPIVPVANARILAGLIPNATLHVFNGGHVEPLAAARDFVPVITRFVLREQPSPSCDWQCGHRVGHVR